MSESQNYADVLINCQKDDTLADMHAELAELERKLIPLLNKVRAMQRKPAVIVPKSQDYWK